KNDRSILSATCLGHFLSHFNMLVFPALLLPLTRRLDMAMGDVLALGFLMYLLFGLSALPWGLLADRFGARRLLILFSVGAGLCALWAGLAIDDPGQLRLALAGLGLFSGIYHPAGLGWIAKAVSRTAAGMAYNGMFGNLGLATAPLMAGLVNYFSGPAAVYLLVALFNLLGLLPLLLVRQSAPSCAVSHPGNKNASWSRFAVLLLAMMLGGMIYRGTTVTLPALFELRGSGLYGLVAGVLDGGLSANVLATAFVSLLYLVAMAGQYAGGRVGERFDLRWGYLAFHALALPAALAMGWLVDLPLVLVAIYHGFFLLGMQPMENTLVARLTPPGLHSSAFGLKFVLTFGVGSLSVQLVRFIASTKGISAVFPVLALLSALLLLVILLLIRLTPPLRS
ncbi:MAG: MFS transporter, partial [Thermodesulfobacteriota bacterium]